MKAKSLNPLAKLAAESAQRLRAQQITPTSPGSILSDVQVLVDFIRSHDLRSKSRQGNLPAEVLPELNAQLSAPLELALIRPLLRDYPNLAGLFILLRVMDLVQPQKGRLRPNERAVERWAALNPTEQYFALLEAWLFLAEHSVLGRSEHRLQSQFVGNLRFLSQCLSPRWRTFPDFCHKSEFTGAVSAWNTQLQMRFGLIEVKAREAAHRASATRRGWLMEKARRTPWGAAVAWALWEFLDLNSIEELFANEKLDEAGFGTLQPTFQPFFPEWQQVYRLTAVAAPRGVWIVKASLGKVWRRLAVPDGHTLHDLAVAVLDAFNFEDTEHLYEFRFRDARGKSRAYQHPYCEEGPFASEVSLAECRLPVKGTMQFLFDFGDDWRFAVRLEQIAPPDPKLRYPKVLATGGQAPRQYEGW